MSADFGPQRLLTPRITATYAPLLVRVMRVRRWSNGDMHIDWRLPWRRMGLPAPRRGRPAAAAYRVVLTIEGLSPRYRAKARAIADSPVERSRLWPLSGREPTGSVAAVRPDSAACSDEPDARNQGGRG